MKHKIGTAVMIADLSVPVASPPQKKCKSTDSIMRDIDSTTCHIITKDQLLQTKSTFAFLCVEGH